MKSRSNQPGPVHRIVFGTATLVAMGSLLILAASRVSSRAVASPSDGGVSYNEYGESPYLVGDPGNGEQQLATLGDDPLNGVAGGPADGPVRVRCCVSSAGSCALLAGAACPSGTTQQACPCGQAV